MKIFLTTALLVISSLSLANNNTLNFYSWANYLPNSVIQKFEKETGIHINYTVYDSNETLYAKLRADPNAGYDIIIPSSYFIGRMYKAGLLQNIDKSKIKNFHNLNPSFLNLAYDPHNNFSIPYLWGATGIGVNKKYIDPKSIARWSDFWDAKYKDQLMILDDMREVFSMALLTQGYPINDTNPDHIKNAYLKLVELLPNIRLFNDDAIQNILVDEDVHIAMIYNGDFYQASTENKDLRFIYPQDGFTIWIDNIAIPKSAPHLANAYKFINFILRPDIAEEIATHLGYSTPNLAAIKLMPQELRNNPILNPSAEILKRGQLLTDSGQDEALYEKYWELLKIGG